ncbi:S1 family peptidase [Paenibacillus sp. KS-LC4]|uniref:S1 family peptidase n=1 Tax=Paenibacillus sp. KS-LC4 TaxID=2979727 RepID=UPI0030D3721B
MLVVLVMMVSLIPSGYGTILGSSVVKAEESVNILSKAESNELKFRKEFGLDSSLVTVQNTIKNNEVGKYGVHLSPTEEAKLNLRIEYQEKVNSALTTILDEKLGSEYTLYIDQSNNGTYHIGVKNKGLFKLENLETLIDPLFTGEYKYRIETISYSESDLDETVTKINENLEYLKRQNIMVNQVYTDVINQRVNVGVVMVTEEKKKVLENLFGNMLNIQEAEESGNSNRATTSSTMKGGLKITYTSNSSSYKCSVGFMVKPPNGAKFAVTAGHCYGTNYQQGTNSIGSMVYYKNSGNTDAGMVGGGPSSVDYTGGGIYKTASTNDKYDRTQNASEDVVGEAICMSGASSDTNSVSCGTLNSKNYSATFSGTTFTKLRKASYTSVGGDSGGTVYGGTTLKGVNKGYSGSDGVYSHLEYVMSDLASSYGGAVHILF